MVYGLPSHGHPQSEFLFESLWIDPTFDHGTYTHQVTLMLIRNCIKFGVGCIRYGVGYLGFL